MEIIYALLLGMLLGAVYSEYRHSRTEPTPTVTDPVTRQTVPANEPPETTARRRAKAEMDALNDCISEEIELDFDEFGRRIEREK